MKFEKKAYISYILIYKIKLKQFCYFRLHQLSLDSGKNPETQSSVIIVS